MVPRIIELSEIKVDIPLSNQQNIPKETPPTPKTRNSIENEWNIGCCKIDRRCVMYFSQLIILSLCICVSLYQVITLSENKDFWIGLLSSCIGILIPNPKLSKKE